jgi:dTDP-4-dehydrorhamnose 3,5-epimerase
MGTRYVAEGARGLRWDDPRLAIHWPARPAVISERDATYPDMDPELADA